MSGMRPYIVRQGDYLTKVAFYEGCDEAEVWSQGANKDCREQHPNPQCFSPGDVLFVPERPPRHVPLAIEMDNPLLGEVPTVDLPLTFLQDGAPFDRSPCRVYVPGEEPREVRTGGGGDVTLSVPVTARSIHVAFDDLGMVYEVLVGALPPGSAEAGVRGRLINLGYLGDAELFEVSPEESPAETTSDALRTLQNGAALPAAGEISADMTEVLMRLHGC